MANDLLVRILGDSRSLERAFKRASKSASTFNSDMDKSSKKFSSFAKGAVAGGALGLAAREVISIVAPMIGAASDLNEQLSRTRVVFERSSDDVVAWSETTARSMGIAQAAALDAAGTFGAMFDQAGQSSEDAARLSKTVVQLASDLASFNNTTVDDALTALRSGLSGEIEPLRRFQVFLTEAAVAQQAMADTGKASSKELTQGEKILARYALILQQTGKQQGDFARTSDGLANQQRVLAASVKDLQANMGRLLLPAVTKVTGALVEATDVALKLSDGLSALADVKIPTITIPFDIEIGGSRLGGALGKAANIGSFIAFPGPRFAKLIADQIGDRFADDTRSVTPELAESFRQSLDTMLSDALKSASANVRTKPEDFANLPGVDFGHADTIIGAVEKAQAVARRRIADALAKGRAARRKDSAERAADARKDAADERRRAAERAAEIRRAVAEERRAALQAAQFRALGLASSGGEIVPGVENLRRQLGQLTERLAGADVQSKLVNRLAGVRRLLKGEFGKVTEETRAAINDLFRTIRGEFEKETSEPLTKTAGINTRRIIEGLGLSPEDERVLRARLSHFNTQGRALRGQTTSTAFAAAAGTPVVESHVTIQMDSDIVARAVTRSQQKTRRRNPPQKRGPNSGV